MVLPELPAGSAATEKSRATRDGSVDALRGAAMILMALDHVRHFFSDSLAVRPTDLDQTSAALFMTRWITHFCAPIFVFFAGTGAYLSTVGAAGKSIEQLSRFLVTRGLWLVFLELTVVRCLGWTFNFDYHYSMAGVLWALGWSMIVLAVLIRLSPELLLAFAAIIVLGHDALDSAKPSAFGPLAGLWKVLHTSRLLEPFSGVHFKVAYPLIPWIGVMPLGYAFGPLTLRPETERRRILLRLGGAAVSLFVILRLLNVYGDPHDWTAQQTATKTVLAFINCDKYPASLLFLLMTLGPAVCALAVVDTLPSLVKSALRTFGRVPLFYYLLHLPFIHLLAMAFAHARYGDVHWLRQNPPTAHGPPFPAPDGYGYGLPIVYALWIGIVIVLYPLCRWFAGVKARRRNELLSYL